MSFNGYNAEYLENLLEMYAGSMDKISSIRWEFIAQLESKLILDYGCGNNAFSLYRPDGVVVDSYDIGMIGNAKYPQTGIRHEKYDLICLWDVMEHVDWELKPDTAMLETIAKAKSLAATIPILENGDKMDDWKHYKPGEHLTYFTVNSFLNFIESLDFVTIKHGQPECPPRKDIHSFLFKRKA